MSTMRDKRQRLAQLGATSMSDKRQRLADLGVNLPRAVQDAKLEAVRAKKAELDRRFKHSGPAKRQVRGFSQLECLRGDAGPEARELLRDLLISGRVSCNNEATAEEFRAQFGKTCPRVSERRGMGTQAEAVSRKPEFRNWKSEVRTETVGGKRKIVGYGAVFNQLSEPMRIGNRVVRERVMPGAFDKCLASKPDIRGLINHDPNMILGRTAAGTMRVSVDSHGAKYEIDPPNTGYASDLMESLSRGDIDQSSFGFFTIDDGYVPDNDGMIRELREVECFDFSPVTFPAYVGASSGLRAAEEI